MYEALEAHSIGKKCNDSWVSDKSLIEYLDDC